MKVFVEAQAGSPDKYDYNEQTLEFKGIRTAVAPYPYPYGFICGTLTPEGDGIDCYLITQSSLEPGNTVECEPIGMLEFFEGDELDHKIIAVLGSEAAQPAVTELSQNPAKWTALHNELQDFIYTIFTSYPEMQVRVGKLLPKKAALEFITRYQEKNTNNC